MFHMDKRIHTVFVSSLIETQLWSCSHHNPHGHSKPILGMLVPASQSSYWSVLQRAWPASQSSYRSVLQRA